jgi:hypothetical protein
MKYLEEINGDLHVCKDVATSDKSIVTIAYKVDKDKLIENEEYEELIELQKMRYFSMQSALKFWDNFDYGLYIRILKEKNKK